VELVEIEMKNANAPSRSAAAPRDLAASQASEPVPVEQEPHHRWIFENQYVRVLDVVLAPSESTLFHTHSHDSIAVRLTDSQVQEQPAHGEWKPASKAIPGESRYMEGTKRPLCLAKTLSVPKINSLRNFLNRKSCYDYGPCSTFRGYV